MYFPFPYITKSLDRLEHWGLVSLGSLDDLAGAGVGGRDGLAGSLAVKVHQLVEVEAGPLEDLDLADVDLVQVVDTLASLLNVDGDGVGDELGDDLLEVAGGDFAGDDVDHLFADLSDLKRKSIH